MLVQVQGEQKSVIQKSFREHVKQGTLVFTDSHKSYHWLAGAGYVHRCVNHKQRDFSHAEVIFGEEVLVSSNAAEGLFGRCKTFVRNRGGKQVTPQAYAGILAEFIWRTTHGAEVTMERSSNLLCGRTAQGSPGHPHTQQ